MNPFSNPDRFDPEDFGVFWTPAHVVKPLIVKNHYSHKMPASPWHCFGIYNRERRLIGGLVYGGPVRRELHETLSPLLKEGEVMELLRLWVEDGPKMFNIESWAIGQTIALLKLAAPCVKMLVSYSDPSEGHKGTIYQATNWLYQDTHQGNHSPRSFSVSFNKSPRQHANDWIHSRTAVRRFGTSNPKRLAQMCGRPILVKPESPKYRYVNFLCDRLERKRLEKSLYLPATRNYPQELIACEGIQVVAA